jgi:hypothetical protein
VEAVCLFFDNVSGYDHRRLWAGVLIKGRQRAEQLAGVAAKRVGRILRLEPSAFEIRNHSCVMKRPLSRSAFDHPVLELYDSGAMTIGFYPSGTARIQSSPTQELISRTTRLLGELILSFEGESPGHTPRRARKAARSRKSVATRRTAPRGPYPPRSAREVALLRESVVTRTTISRDRPQAMAAKRRDHFTCQLCGERPENLYGKVGRACLQAHHLQPVRTPRGRRSLLSKLVTVCANCHQVLERLPQGQRSFRQLRDRFRKG